MTSTRRKFCVVIESAGPVSRTMLDGFTRECLCIHVDRRINAAKVRAIMSELIGACGSPGYIRSDNGSEFIEKSLPGWYAEEGIKTLYIESGSPWQNGFI